MLRAGNFTSKSTATILDAEAQWHMRQWLRVSLPQKFGHQCSNLSVKTEHMIGFVSIKTPTSLAL
jgi:hypothetical protein